MTTTATESGYPVTAEPTETTDLVPAQQGTLLGARTDVPHDLDQMLRLADVVCRAGLLPQHLRNNPSNVVAIMIASRALDLPLWQGIQELHSVDGKIGMSANLMRALWLRAGHGFRVVERTDEHVVVEATRKGCEPYAVEYTMDDARTANLAGKGNWSKYPKQMMVARATSTCLREVGSDILLGFYTPDELSEGSVSPELDVRIEPALTAEDIAAAEQADREAWAEACGEIAVAADKDTLRDLYRKYNAVDLLGVEYDGTTLAQKIEQRAAELDIEQQSAETEDEVEVEDPDPDQLALDGSTRCGKCTEGRVGDYACGHCNGSGRVGGAA